MTIPSYDGIMEAVRITFREVAKMSETPINPFDDAEEIAKRSMVIFFVIDLSLIHI
mgnify:CR=1 FL=1